MAKKVGSVSVRGGLLALLTMGPAYGFQLHGEFAARTAERRTVNVGQVYATLNRLVRAGAVAAAGVTDDGLPLYSLSDAGSDEARCRSRTRPDPPPRPVRNGQKCSTESFSRSLSRKQTLRH